MALEATIPLNTENQLNIQRERTDIFVYNNRYENGTHTDVSGSAKTLAAGTLMGRISASGLLTPLASGATDGSQFPVGILTQDIAVAASATVSITIGVSGDVDENKLVFDGSDDLNTVVTGRRLRDRIAADTVGIKLVGGIEMTSQDNQ